MGGIFPPAERPAAEGLATLRCDADEFRNYHGVEEHPVTEQEMQTHIDDGHLVEFDTYEELSAFVKGKPVLNKLGLIVKERHRQGTRHPRYKREWSEVERSGSPRTVNE